MKTYPKNIHIGSGLDEDGIFDFLQGSGRKDDVTSPLLPVAQEFMHSIKDVRANVLSVKVNSVNVDPTFPRAVHVHFTVEWDLYHGCADRNEYDHDDLDEIAIYTDDGNLIFQIPEPRRPSNPC